MLFSTLKWVNENTSFLFYRLKKYHVDDLQTTKNRNDR